jgi:hypothetical protein
MDGGNADFAGAALNNSAITLSYPQSDSTKQNLRVQLSPFLRRAPPSASGGRSQLCVPEVRNKKGRENPAFC